MKVILKSVERQFDSVLVRVEFSSDEGESIATKEYNFRQEEEVSLASLKEFLKKERDRIDGLQQKVTALSNYIGKEISL